MNRHPLVVRRDTRGFVFDNGLVKLPDRHLGGAFERPFALKHRGRIDAKPELFGAGDLVLVAAARMSRDVLEHELHGTSAAIERHTAAASHVYRLWPVWTRICDEDTVPSTARRGHIPCVER